LPHFAIGRSDDEIVLVAEERFVPRHDELQASLLPKLASLGMDGR
jgi:hypothetical protein